MRLIRLCMVLLLVAGSAVAQDTADIAPVDPPVEIVANAAFADQADWEALTTRIETALQTGRASTSVLGELRSELADWRDTFLSRQSLNASRIATVQSQVTALGAVPESGEEDPRIAARRAVLSEQLRDLSAPATLAAEAYTQADGLIGEIDSLLRERQAETFTQRTQSPLNPSGWARTADVLAVAVRSMKAEVSGNISNPSRQTELMQNLPAILVLMAIAVVFVLRGRAWFNWLANLIVARTRRGQGVVQFLMSFGQIIIPLIGLIAFTIAVQATGMIGRRLDTIIEAVPAMGLLAIFAHWIAGQLLPRNMADDVHPLGMSPEISSRAHVRLIILGYAMMAYGLVFTFTSANSFDQATMAVVLFPFGAMVAWTLYWFGHILRKDTTEDTEDVAQTFRMTLRRLACRGLMGAAVIGVVFAAVGYSNAFEVLTYPAAMTIYVLAVLMLLQRLSVDVYSLLTNTDNAATDALVPVFTGFLLILFALPILAIIWGAQVTDITELWARFREGFAIGETRISPTSFLLFAAVFVVGYTITRLVQAALRTTVLPRTKLDTGGQNAIVSGMGYVGIFLAAVVAITTAGINLSGLAIVAGALSVGIGFGLQNIVSNFISGIILLIERPISHGDWIEVGGQMGIVRDISVRSTRIETFDRTDVIVPNADLISNQVINWTRGNSVGRVIVPVGVAYGTDTEWIASILQEIAEAHPMVLLNPPPSVVFMGFGADSLDFEIRAILRDVNYVLLVKSEMNHAIAKRFVEDGIEIPFGQRDIWLRNPEALNAGGKRPVAKSKPATKPKGPSKS